MAQIVLRNGANSIKHTHEAGPSGAAIQTAIRPSPHRSPYCRFKDANLSENICQSWRTRVRPVCCGPPEMRSRIMRLALCCADRPVYLSILPHPIRTVLLTYQQTVNSAALSQTTASNRAPLTSFIQLRFPSQPYRVALPNELYPAALSQPTLSGRAPLTNFIQLPLKRVSCCTHLTRAVVASRCAVLRRSRSKVRFADMGWPIRSDDEKCVVYTGLNI